MKRHSTLSLSRNTEEARYTLHSCFSHFFSPPPPLPFPSLHSSKHERTTTMQTSSTVSDAQEPTRTAECHSSGQHRTPGTRFASLGKTYFQDCSGILHVVLSSSAVHLDQSAPSIQALHSASDECLSCEGRHSSRTRCMDLDGRHGLHGHCSCQLPRIPRVATVQLRCDT